MPYPQFYSPAEQAELGIVGFMEDGTPITRADLQNGAIPQASPEAVAMGLTSEVGARAEDAVDMNAYPPEGMAMAPSGQMVETHPSLESLQAATPMSNDAIYDDFVNSDGSEYAYEDGTVPLPGPSGGPDTPVEMGAYSAPQNPMAMFEQAPAGDIGNYLSSALLGFAQGGRGVPYGGGLQGAISGMAGGVRSYQDQMARMRSGLGMPSSVREFAFAQANGYTGTYMDFKKEFGGNIFGQMMQTMAMQNQQNQQQYQRNQTASKANIAADEKEYRREQDAIQQGIATENRETRKEQNLLAQTQKLEKSIPQELTDMNSALGNVRSLVSEYEESKGGGVDLPGYGPIESMKPGFTLGDEGTNMRAAVGAVRNTILKARSGGAVSDGEAGRMLEELAMGAGKGEAGMLRAFNSIQKGLNTVLQKKYNSFSPEVVEQYLGKPYVPVGPVFQFKKDAQSEIDAEIKRRGL